MKKKALGELAEGFLYISAWIEKSSVFLRFKANVTVACDEWEKTGNYAKIIGGRAS